MLWVSSSLLLSAVSAVAIRAISSKKMSIKSVLWNKWTWASGNNIWQIVPDDWVHVVLNQLHLETVLVWILCMFLFGCKSFVFPIFLQDQLHVYLTLWLFQLPKIKFTIKNRIYYDDAGVIGIWIVIFYNWLQWC